MKKNLKNILFTIAIIAITIFASIYLKYNLDTKIENNQNENTEIINGQTENNTNDSIEFEEAIVTKIIDGDTIGVTIDGKYYKVRF